MKPHEDPPSLESLKEDIARLSRKVSPPVANPQPQGMQVGLRMGLELASGVLVGAGVGMLLDKWFGTSPILCLLCLMLGAGGGFLTIYRTMQAMDKETDAAPGMPEIDEEE